jgi:hypothetical protein
VAGAKETGAVAGAVAGAVPQSTIVEASTQQLAGPSKLNVEKSSVHSILFSGLGGNLTI